MAAAAATIPEIAQTAMNVAGAASALHGLAQKYAPKVRGIANVNFHRKAQSAANYVKKLGTARGFKKFITKDVGRAARKTSKFISSGKALKAIEDVGADVGHAVSAVEGVTGRTELGDTIRGSTQSAVDTARHHHQILEGYNDRAKEMGSQMKEAYKRGMEPQPM